MTAGWILPALVAAPAALAGLSLLARSPRAALWVGAVATAALALVAGCAVAQVAMHGPLQWAGGWFFLDGLSAYHLAVLMAVFVLCAFFAIVYFRKEIADGAFTRRQARRYQALWFGSLAAMNLVLVSNNLGLMWVGIEATTLLSAFLICIHASPAALEATWKYLLMCSVGVAIAFAGILLLAAAASASLSGQDSLLWTRLMNPTVALNPMLVKVAFIFLVVGFGTKAGLAPLHSWLPDAHSQAPAPVSAMFSGFLLNTALYCILRCLPIVEAATGDTEWGREILAALGILSILVAAAFIVGQHDVKRLLAYHSVEHLGIIAIGVGVGGLGVWAALFHTLNHSVCKTLSFFCAGILGQTYGTHDMRRMTGVVRDSPVWGSGLIGSLLALIGVAPFALFLSEFLILKAALNAGAYVTAALFLVGLGIVFIGALGHAISMAWGRPETAPQPSRVYRAEALLAWTPLAMLLALGLWIPPPLGALITQAAAVLGVTP
ncbi:MAG: proton-conducting transporter membrane subunit [Thermoguttaceae bacterium]|jgi:hydrogenase-4 component F